MSAAQFIPSPLGGEGYGALPLKAARRSWMRGCAPQARAIAVRPLTPHPASTRRASRQVFATLSPNGKIGRAHVCTPVTNAHLVCRLLLEKNKRKEREET